MKQTVLDVLVYLFEHYLDNLDNEMGFAFDQESLKLELTEAGFDDHEVVRAFEWLQGLGDRKPVSKRDSGVAKGSAIRVYTAREVEKLDVHSRGLLIFLEEIGVLDRHSRELVIDRVMALEADDIDLDRVKWVILMVLFNQGGLDSDFLWTEYLVKGELEALH